MLAEKGRKVLVLTERTEHLDAIQTALGDKVPALFVLHGRIAKKQRATLIAELNALPPDAPRVLLATGKLVGDLPTDMGKFWAIFAAIAVPVSAIAAAILMLM